MAVRLRAPGGPRPSDDVDPSLDTSGEAGRGAGPALPGPPEGPVPPPTPGSVGIDPKSPFRPVFAAGGESPRERAIPPHVAGGFAPPPPPSAGGEATPTRPTTPTPDNGAVTPPAPGVSGGAGAAGPQPFSPMPSVGAEGLINPAGAGPTRRSLFGGASGLLNGGLGVPGGPNQYESDPISSLLQLLTQKRGGSFGGF